MHKVTEHREGSREGGESGRMENNILFSRVKEQVY